MAVSEFPRLLLRSDVGPAASLDTNGVLAANLTRGSQRCKLIVEAGVLQQKEKVRVNDKSSWPLSLIEMFVHAWVLENEEEENQAGGVRSRLDLDLEEGTTRPQNAVSRGAGRKSILSLAVAPYWGRRCGEGVAARVVVGWESGLGSTQTVDRRQTGRPPVGIRIQQCATWGLPAAYTQVTHAGGSPSFCFLMALFGALWCFRYYGAPDGLDPCRV